MVRLIDADAMKTVEQIQKADFNSIETIRAWIDLQPTIEERKKGIWLTTAAYPHRVYCLHCFKTYANADWEVWKDGSLPRAYCPNCGAQMVEAKEGVDYEAY